MAKEREIERWITVNGARVPIFKGQSKEEVVKNFIQSRAGKAEKEARRLSGNETGKLSKSEKFHIQMQEEKRRREEGIKTKYTSPNHSKLDQHSEIQKIAENHNREVWTRKGGVANKELYDAADKFAEKNNLPKQKVREAAMKAFMQKHLESVKRRDRGEDPVSKQGSVPKQNDQINKDLDEKERQIAQNKAEADRASGKNEHYDTVLNDIRGKLDRGELTPEQARNKAFEYEKGQRDNKQWTDVDKNKMQSKVRDIFDSTNKKEQESRQSSTGKTSGSTSGKNYDNILTKNLQDRDYVTKAIAYNRGITEQEAQKQYNSTSDEDKAKYTAYYMSKGMVQSERQEFTNRLLGKSSEQSSTKEKQFVNAVEELNGSTKEATFKLKSTGETFRGQIEEYAGNRVFYKDLGRGTHGRTDASNLLVEKQSSTGNKTSSGGRTIQQMSAAQADGLRKLKEISSSKRFNEITFERPTTGDTLRVSVEKVKTRDYWGRSTGEQTYTLNIWNNSKTNEYGNHEKEYYDYGIKDMKEVKRVIKRYMSM